MLEWIRAQWVNYYIGKSTQMLKEIYLPEELLQARVLQLELLYFLHQKPKHVLPAAKHVYWSVVKQVQKIFAGCMLQLVF